MRNTITVSLFFLFILPVVTVNAAKIDIADVPWRVLKGLKNEHPGAKNIQVDKERHFGLTLYEVKFNIDDKQHETLFDPKGWHFGHEEAIKPEHLPSAVIRTLNKTFKQFTIKDVEEIRHPGNERIEYEIDIHGDGEDWELAMDPFGKILVKERD